MLPTTAKMNSKTKEEIYPLTIKEIADAQKRDRHLKVYFKPRTIITKEGYGFHLIENTKVLCKERKVIIPTTV